MAPDDLDRDITVYESVTGDSMTGPGNPSL
jgi:hypothetical protein